MALSLVELVKAADNMTMVDEDGRLEHLRLAPPLSPSELSTLEQQLPCTLPADVLELLVVTRGFANGPLESVDFAGVPGGFGNYWIADLHAESTSWGPILYACHDPPVIVFQTASFTHFLS